MKSMPMSRRLCWVIALAVTAYASAGPAAAQNFPNRPVRIVVPFAAGGAVDTVGRIVATKMSEQLGQPVIVENRTGAGGNIGADAVAKSPPDGYTLLLTTSGHAITPALYRTVPYDAVKDFTPVSQVLATTFVLVSSPKLPVASISDVIALAKSKPGGLNYGSSGLGAPLHLAMEVFKHSAGIDVQHIPYRGDAPVNAALIGGEIQLAVVPQSTGLPFIKAGSIRPLGVTGSKRSPVLPEVPTIAEAGVTGLEVRSWNGLFAPAGTPREVVLTIQKAVAASMASAEVRDRILAMGQDPIGNTPEEFDALFKSDLARFAKVIEQAKIQRLD
jgi:tripartite-type tricarboxylate transporter receptor subunit TctC